MKLLRESVEPSWIKSNADKLEDSFVRPYTERFDPRRAKDLKLMEEPKWIKSSTLTLSPNRLMP
jgi:hypothetical protein